MDNIKVKSAYYTNTDHTQIGTELEITEDNETSIIPYFFTPDTSDTSEVYLYLQDLWNKGELIPETNKQIEDLKLAEEIREKRNNLLLESDKYMIEDYPISKEDKDLVKKYRQDLRNITDQKSFPYNVVWPVFPLK